METKGYAPVRMNYLINHSYIGTGVVLLHLGEAFPSLRHQRGIQFLLMVCIPCGSRVKLPKNSKTT